MVVIYVPINWTGDHDAGNNDVYKYVETGEVLPDNSALWHPRHPIYRNCICVVMSRTSGKLYDAKCKYVVCFVFEAEPCSSGWQDNISMFKMRT